MSANRIAPPYDHLLLFAVWPAVFVSGEFRHMVFEQVAEALKRRLCALLGVYLVQPTLQSTCVAVYESRYGLSRQLR
jgi:hypothetical protein